MSDHQHPQPPEWQMRREEQDKAAKARKRLEEYAATIAGDHLDTKSLGDKRILDLRNHRYFAVTCKEYVGQEAGGTRWNLVCMCGNFHTAYSALLTKTSRAHCGCLNGLTQAEKQAKVALWLNDVRHMEYQEAFEDTETIRKMFRNNREEAEETALLWYLREKTRYTVAVAAQTKIQDHQMAIMENRERRRVMKTPPGSVGSAFVPVTSDDVDKSTIVKAGLEYVGKQWERLRWATGALVVYNRSEAEYRGIISQGELPLQISPTYELIVTRKV